MMGSNNTTEQINDLEDDAPAGFICPILQEIMTDPVSTADGHSYEREAIARWLIDHDTSPNSNEQLPSKILIPNHSLRNAIQDWKNKRNAMMQELQKINKHNQKLQEENQFLIQHVNAMKAKEMALIVYINCISPGLNFLRTAIQEIIALMNNVSLKDENRRSTYYVNLQACWKNTYDNIVNDHHQQQEVVEVTDMAVKHVAIFMYALDSCKKIIQDMVKNTILSTEKKRELFKQLYELIKYVYLQKIHPDSNILEPSNIMEDANYLTSLIHNTMERLSLSRPSVQNKNDHEKKESEEKEEEYLRGEGKDEYSSYQQESLSHVTIRGLFSEAMNEYRKSVKEKPKTNEDDLSLGTPSHSNTL